MSRPIRTGDWVYLIASFALSLWLIEAQKQDLSLSDLRLMTFHRASKIVRSMNIFLMEIEVLLVNMCNAELEGRKY